VVLKVGITYKWETEEFSHPILIGSTTFACSS